jgi:putative phosphoribosyl transferase
MLPASSRTERYHDRREAGQMLARHLAPLAQHADLVVLALPRGGVPVAYEVATALGAPLDVFLVRKLGAPLQPELAMGAIASGGIRTLNPGVIAWFGLTPEAVERVTRAEQQELERREVVYRGGRPAVDVAGKLVVLVDDGLATGSTMRAAVLALRRLKPSRIVVAVPVGAEETCTPAAVGADDVVCLRIPRPFSAVGLWYEDFGQTTDAEVIALLRAATAASASAGERS